MEVKIEKAENGYVVVCYSAHDRTSYIFVEFKAALEQVAMCLREM